jgi:VanZ family protein
MATTCDNKSRESFNFNNLLRLALPILWAGIICWLSLTSTPPTLIPGILGWDKLQHAVAYALLSILVAQYLYIYTHITKTVFYAGCLVILYGGLMEVLQLMMQAGRLAEWWDLVADIIGALTGCVIFRQASVVISQNHARNETDG